jgi:hippurate hydrolase
MPHQGNDPIVIAAAIVSALQSIVARNVDPLEAGVITIGAINGGDAFNIIPERVTMRGTARWFKPEVGQLLERKFVEVCQGIAAAFGAKAEARFLWSYPATVNEPAATQATIPAAAAVVGEARVINAPKPTMGGEDFAFMLNACPGSYIMLGTGRGEADPQLHHPKFDFNDEMLPVGASYWAALTEQSLPRR